MQNLKTLTFIAASLAGNSVLSNDIRSTCFHNSAPEIAHVSINLQQKAVEVEQVMIHESEAAKVTYSFRLVDFGSKVLWAQQDLQPSYNAYQRTVGLRTHSSASPQAFKSMTLIETAYTVGDTHITVDHYTCMNPETDN